MNEVQLQNLLKSLRALPREEEWVEFKVNNFNPEEIGEYISALSNVARLMSKDGGYLVWGIDDVSHEIVGTSFKPREEKFGNQEIESWLACHLHPAVDFRFYEFVAADKPIVLLDIPRCLYMPVRWKETAYIRVGTYKKKLNDFPEKERALWADHDPFERGSALKDVSGDVALSLLNFTAYFDMTKQTLPSDKLGILDRFTSEQLIVRKSGDRFDITNFGAILFAKKLSDFPSLRRKAVRIITYAGGDRTAGGREFVADEGYAVCFESVVKYVNGQLPINEHIEQAFRIATPTYPEITIRELVPNAMIHQDLTVGGSSPLIEIFTDRMEITNPGRPLIPPLRFIDEPPRSRNQDLASFMRRINICEERGSGIDKVVKAVELFQLPAPDFTDTESSTRVTLFAKRDFRNLTSQERIRACYWHACLQNVSGTEMTNETLRKRFGLDESKHNQVGRIISDARKANVIKPYDPDNKSPRYARYVPFWA
jgi:ATP-dependent DNA helicase RecG